MTDKKKIKVRILEDDQGEWELIEHHLEKHGITDFTFYFQSSHLLADLHTEKQVVVLDYKLSEGDNGFQVMIKAKKQSPESYYIIATGFNAEDLLSRGINSDELIIDFLNAKADFFIKKTITNYYDRLAEAILDGIAEVERIVKREDDRDSAEKDLKAKAKTIDELFTKIQQRSNDRKSTNNH